VQLNFRVWIHGCEASLNIATWFQPGCGLYSDVMGKASDWLREERRKVLGDWVAVCARCGAARRWFEEFEDQVPDECPQCGGELLRRCKSCGAPFSSIAVVDCEECGKPVRPDELFGSPIRRRKRS